MNRRYRRCQCMNNMNNYNQDAIEEKCLNISSYNNQYEEDKCACGFDEEEVYDVFPTNPMLAQSYVPIQYMDKTFKPCVRLKTWNYFSRVSKPI